MARKLHRARRMLPLRFERDIPGLLSAFVAGCFIGSIVGWRWESSNLFLWSDWPSELRVGYAALLRCTLRIPVCLWFCRVARLGRRIVPLLLCWYGAQLSGVAAEQMCRYHFWGIGSALMMLWPRLLMLPAVLYAALLCRAQPTPGRMDGLWLGEFAALLLLGAVLTALEYWTTPLLLSLLMWLQ